MAWIAIGIIFGVIGPLMLLIVCGVYCYRKKEKKSDLNWKINTSRSRSNSRSGSRVNLRRVDSDASDTTHDQDTLKNRDSPGAVYRTNEPLVGRPNDEFPEKKNIDENNV